MCLVALVDLRLLRGRGDRVLVDRRRKVTVRQCGICGHDYIVGKLAQHIAEKHPELDRPLSVGHSSLVREGGPRMAESARKPSLDELDRR